MHLSDILPGRYPEMMNNYLANQVYLNQAKHPAPTTVAGVQAMQRDVRAIIARALGPLPAERTDLNARVIRRVAYEDYAVEVIKFESQPGVWVTANLYLPAQLSGPAPAILTPHGHYLHGKMQPVIQLRCIGLARRGFVVLVPDKMGYGERVAQGHEDNLFLLMAGRSLMALEVWDNIRAIDYLCARPEVDPERIGCTGASGGGAQTMYTAALDQRIKVAVPVCSVATIDGIHYGGIYCSCECLPGTASSWDIPDLCALIAPRPLMLINGIQDELFLIAGGRKAAQRLKQVYETLGAPENFAFVETFDGHGYSLAMRQAMYRWFLDHLEGNYRGPLAEQAAKVEPIESPRLNAGQELHKGNQSQNIPLASFQKAVAGLAGHWPAIPANAAAWSEQAQTLRDHIKALFGESSDKPEKARLVNRVSMSPLHEEMIIESEAGIWIPARLLLPSAAQCRHPVVVFLRDEGKRYAENLQFVDDLLQKGIAVLTLDYRGIGATEPAVPRPLAEDPEMMLFQSAVILGRPLFGMRLFDIVAAASWLKRHPAIDPSRIYCWGAYGAALLAVFATGLHDCFAGAVLHQPLISYVSKSGYVPQANTEGGVVSYRSARTPLRLPSFFLPGILHNGDVPHIAALAAPRPLLIVGGVKGNGQQAAPTEVAAAFSWTERVYAMLGRDSLTIFAADPVEQGEIANWLAKKVND